LRDFCRRSRDADIAVVYYAGHGMEVERYELPDPVDASSNATPTWYDEAFSLDRAAGDEPASACGS